MITRPNTYTGNETGVTVNGMIATVYGNQFIANHVPLVDGANTITITATDTNRAYHEGSECDCYQGVLRNCMSETQTLKTTDSKSGIKVLRKDSVTEAATSDNAQMLHLTHKQRKMPMER